MLVFKGASEIDVSDFPAVNPVVLRAPQPTIDIKATGRKRKEGLTKLGNAFILALRRYGCCFLIDGLNPPQDL
jgi:hypothetical protein